MTTKAISYLRVSGRGQLDGDGYDRQRAAIEKYAAANDLELVGEFEDGGVSGTTELENRVGLAAALERIENNGVKLMVIEAADRLARDAMVSELIIRQFQKAGGVIVTASGVNLTEGNDANPTAALIRGVLALIAEFDKRVTVLKLKAARDRIKSKTGKCEGVKAFGIYDDERRTLELMISMRSRGVRYAVIAKHLNELSGHPTRSGKPWSVGTIAKILARAEAENAIGQRCASDSQGEL